MQIIRSFGVYELEERCGQVKVKPRTFEIEVEMYAQIDSENYDDVDGDKALPKQLWRWATRQAHEERRRSMWQHEALFKAM